METEAFPAGCFTDVPPRFVQGEVSAVPADCMSRTHGRVAPALLELPPALLLGLTGDPSSPRLGPQQWRVGGRKLPVRSGVTRSKSLHCNLHYVSPKRALRQDSAVEAADFRAAVSCELSLRCGCCHAQVSANGVQSAGHRTATNPSRAEFPSQKLPGQRCVFCLGRPEFIWHTLPASFQGNEISTRAT